MPPTSTDHEFWTLLVKSSLVRTSAEMRMSLMRRTASEPWSCIMVLWRCTSLSTLSAVSTFNHSDCSVAKIILSHLRVFYLELILSDNYFSGICCKWEIWRPCSILRSCLNISQYIFLTNVPVLVWAMRKEVFRRLGYMNSHNNKGCVFH